MSEVAARRPTTPAGRSNHRACSPNRRQQLTRKASPQNQNTVPVLNTDGTPLTPTKPSRTRRWIESRKATKEWRHGLFAVRLVDNLSNPQTADISLNIDPGSKVTGITIVAHQDNQEATAIAAFELHHRGHQVTQNLIKRQGHRKKPEKPAQKTPGTLQQPEAQGGLAAPLHSGRDSPTSPPPSGT